jgi:hypothetical protein
MVQNYAMPGIPIGKIEIDSLKVRIPLSKVHILNEELGATLVPVNQQTGDVYNDQTYKKNSYKISYKGISIYFGLENQIDGKRDVVEYLVILFSSKLLSERYFEGITETNIGLLYDRLISFGVVSFDYDIFISSECTDVDFKRDDIQNEFRDAVTFLETSAKSYKQKDKGCNPFKSKDKLGIEFGSRNKANERYPFLKMYAKAVELINNSLDFWSEFLSDQGLDIADLVRTEITIKNKKHFMRLGIRDTRLETLLKLSQEQKKEFFVDAFKIHLEPRTTLGRVLSDDLTPKDKIIISLLSQTMAFGRSFDDAKEIILSCMSSPVQRSRSKKELEQLYEENLKGSKEDTKTKRMSKWFSDLGWS